VVRRHLKLVIYAAGLMACFNFFSHGTQDIFPRYLQAQLHFGHVTVSTIVIIYNIGAMLGGIVAGTLSQRFGRRLAIGVAAALSLLCLPLWAFSTTPVMIGLGAFLMQLCVQGAWGVIPVHLNELSPASIRGTFPGFTYQVGNFLAALNLPLQSSIATGLGGDYRWPLAGVAGAAAVLIILLMVFGPEARNVRMGRFGDAAPAGG
jgi:SHS family lactate transporter-like MFS transporter